MHIKNNPKDSVNLFALLNSCCNIAELVFEVTDRVRHKSLISQKNKIWAGFDIGMTEQSLGQDVNHNADMIAERGSANIYRDMNSPNLISTFDIKQTPRI